MILVAGGDPIGTLYAAYRLAERFGVRFYLHGDVVPEGRRAFRLLQVDEIGKPLFDRRGIQPFHDFPEGPDWWNADDYKAILAQLPKLRMNFFGLHTYPEGGVGPEPTTWIGQPADAGPKGLVKSSYPSRHFLTSNVPSPGAKGGAWGYQGAKTSDYAFGAADMFERDDFGADYMQGLTPWPAMSTEQGNALFNRMGEFLDDVFGFARPATLGRPDAHGCLRCPALWLHRPLGHPLAHADSRAERRRDGPRGVGTKLPPLPSKQDREKGGGTCDFTSGRRPHSGQDRAFSKSYARGHQGDPALPVGALRHASVTASTCPTARTR